MAVIAAVREQSSAVFSSSELFIENGDLLDAVVAIAGESTRAMCLAIP
jgi:hypothetical protein